MYYIYKVTNLINNKVYIGQTNNFEKRKREHLTDTRTSHQPFKRALNKYGEENFKWEIIDEVSTKQQADEKEKYYINSLNSKIPNGYNMANGGKGQTNWNLRKIVMLDLEGNLLKKYDTITECEIETKLDHSRISACCKGKSKRYKNYMFMYLEDYEEKGSTKYIKPESARKKAIVQYDLRGNKIREYESVTQASKINNVCRDNISSCLIGKYKSSGGYIWKYKGEKPPRKYAIRGVMVDQYTEDGKFLNRFQNCREAERELGLKKNAYKVILKNLDKKDKVTYGYKWKRV